MVPNIGSVQILFVLAGILAIISLFDTRDTSKKMFVFIGMVIIASIIGVILASTQNNSMEERVLRGELNTQISFDTEYGRALVQNVIIDNKEVRLFNIDSGYESLAYIDSNKKHEPASKYILMYDYIFKSANEINNVLMIGGAGYAYPRYYISNYKDKYMDVVEIDSKVTEIARKYFYLDDLIKEYDLENTKRLKMINEDGRTFVNSNQKKYDAILNDAFSGAVPAKVLTTLEAVQKIKNSLVKDGVYLTNIIGSIEGKDSRFIKAETNTIKQVFKNVYVVPVIYDSETEDNYDKYVKRNNMVIATDQDLKIDGVVTLSVDPSEIVLTDDFCPVDTLVD